MTTASTKVNRRKFKDITRINKICDWIRKDDYQVITKMQAVIKRETKGKKDKEFRDGMDKAFSIWFNNNPIGKGDLGIYSNGTIAYLIFSNYEYWGKNYLLRYMFNRLFKEDIIDARLRRRTRTMSYVDESKEEFIYKRKG